MSESPEAIAMALTGGVRVPNDCFCQHRPQGVTGHTEFIESCAGCLRRKALMRQHFGYFWRYCAIDGKVWGFPQ